MSKKTVQDVDVKGKLVFVRCDFNVPLKEDGTIADDTRIEAALPTIKYLQEQGAKVILASHLGRPKGEVKPEFSMRPVAQSLAQKLNTNVKLAGDVVGDSAKTMASGLQDGEVGLLENLRYGPREEANDKEFCEELANLGGGVEIYVNDAFGTAHRAHASTEGIAHEVDTAVAGMLMQKEIEELGAVVDNPEQPFVAILGGAKVSDKIGVIENLMKKVEKIIIGGAMANTFLKAKGYDIGDSRYEADKLEEAKDIMKQAVEEGVEIVLPVDRRMAKIPGEEKLTPELVEKAEYKEVKLTTEKDVEEGKVESLAGWQVLDVGSRTLDYYADALDGAKTIIWNGPLGYTESEKFAHGTEAIANYIANSNAKCVIGGGDSVAAINRIKKEAIESGEDPKKFDNIYTSTGGGASLEFIEGKKLPGIEALDDVAKQNDRTDNGGNQKSSQKIVE